MDGVWQAAFGVAVSGKTLFISDWDNATVSVYSELTDSLQVIVSEGLGHPAALVYTSFTLRSHNGTLH